MENAGIPAGRVKSSKKGSIALGNPNAIEKERREKKTNPQCWLTTTSATLCL